MILTSLDAKYERLGARLVPLGKKLLVAISVLVVLLLLLDKLTTRPMNWTLFTIVALPSIIGCMVEKTNDGAEKPY